MTRLLTALALAAALALSAQAQPDLGAMPVDPLLTLTDPTTLAPIQRERFEAAVERPWTRDVVPVLTPTLGVSDGLDLLLVNVPGQTPQVASQRSVDVRAPGNYSWVGSLPDGEVVLSVLGDDVSVLVRFGIETYVIEPLGDGVQVLYRVDYSGFPTGGDHTEDGGGEADVAHDGAAQGPSALAFADALATAAAPLASSAGPVGIVAVYNAGAASQSGNIDNTIDQAAAITNASFGNSNVSASVEIVHKAAVSYPDGQSSASAVNALADPYDGHMDEVHALRDQYGGDIAVLFAGDFQSGQAGRAKAIAATSSQAFAVTTWDAAIPDYTFAHEIGHVVGGRHHDDPNTDIPYAHGFVYDPGNWRTILARRENTPTNRINYWSNPDVYFGGVAMGTASFRDNARVWDERAPIVAAFKTATGPTSNPPSNLVITNPANGNMPRLEWDGPSGYTPDAYRLYRKCAAYTSCLNFQLVVETNVGSDGSGSWIDSQVLQQGQSDYYTYKVTAVTNGFESDPSNYAGTYGKPFSPSGGYARVAGPATPEVVELSPSVPNPFSGSATITFGLPEPGPAELVVYDVVGREVARLTEGHHEAGYHSVEFKAGALAPGTYLYRLTTGDGVVTGRMALVR